ncbi:hypothetical protein, partial [Zhongshania sp.]|uniref:hypothetical protein n=1 Tax=Zhongshania sp. TaxID=1971902 RepID=UPI0035694597
MTIGLAWRISPHPGTGVTIEIAWRICRHPCEGTDRSLTDCARLLASAAFQRPRSEYSIWKRRRQQREELLALQGIL